MISKKEVCEWKENGFVVVKNLIPISIVLKCQHYVKSLYDKNELNVSDFGSKSKLECPSFSIIDTLYRMDEKNVLRAFGKNDRRNDTVTLQRSILGIPLPGDSYWTTEKIYYFQSRYPNMDTTPYQKYLQTPST